MEVAYFDHNATTPLDERVLEAMLPYFREKYGNASCLYELGVEASYAVEKARMQVAALLSAKEDGTVFTSGGTESDNIAIRGVLSALPSKKHIIASSVEHPAVYALCEYLGRNGYEISWLEVDSDGRVRPGDVAGSIREDTALVTVMAANNEIGSLQPIAEVGKICRSRGVVFHTDAIQAAGKIPIDVEAWQADLISLSAHKIYGPKGCGALYIRPGTPFISQQIGGPQESGHRGGTENVPGIVGMGMAAQIAMHDMKEREARIERLREMMWDSLSEITDLLRNSPRTDCMPGTLNFSILGVNSRELVRALSAHGFCLTSGSACAQGQSQPSHVLKAIGRSDQEALAALRVSLGKDNSPDEVRRFTHVLPEIVRELRQ